MKTWPNHRHLSNKTAKRHIPPALFALSVLLTATAKKEKEKKPIITGASSGHLTNLKQSILETFDIYGPNKMLGYVLLDIGLPVMGDAEPSYLCRVTPGKQGNVAVIFSRVFAAKIANVNGS